MAKDTVTVPVAATTRNEEGCAALLDATLETSDGLGRLGALIDLVARIDRARRDSRQCRDIPWESSGADGGLQWLLQDMAESAKQMEERLDTARARVIVQVERRLDEDQRRRHG